MIRKLIRRIADALFGPSPEDRNDLPYDPLDDDGWHPPARGPQPPYDRPKPTPGPDEEDAELSDDPPKPKKPTDEDLINEGADFVDRMTKIHGDGSPLNFGGIRMGTHEEIDAAIRKGWQSAWVGFYPHDSAHPLHYKVEKDTFLDDAEGNPVAIVAEGPVTLYFGSRACLAVTWMTKDPVARRVARLRVAPWISVSPSVAIRKREGRDGRTRNDSFRDELETQLDLDVASGRLRPEFADFIRENIGREPSAYTRFFVAYVVGNKRPVQDHDGEPVLDLTTLAAMADERMTWRDR